MVKKLSARRLLSPALLLAVAGCFMLPFATVSCHGERVTPTGMQLVVGQAPPNELNGQDEYSGDLGEDVVNRTQSLAVLAFAGIVLALGAALLLAPPSRLVFLFSELGFLGFIWLAGEGMLTDATVDFHGGYWFGLLGVTASMLLHVSAMRHRGLWAAVAAGIPGLLSPILLFAAGAVVGAIYLTNARRHGESSSQELHPPLRVQTTGKNESSMDASPQA